MTPRISPAILPRRRPRSSYELFREDPHDAPLEERAIWNYLTGPDMGRDPRELMVEEEQRVLSKATSGGGFLVPTDLAEMIVSAARAASPIAQQALELVTAEGTSLGLPLGSTHGSAAWTAESGSFSEAIAAGIPSYEVARMAGTSVTQIEATYAHLFGEHLERSRMALDAFGIDADADAGVH